MTQISLGISYRGAWANPVCHIGAALPPFLCAVLLSTAEVGNFISFWCQIFSGFHTPASKSLKWVTFWRNYSKKVDGFFGTRCMFPVHFSSSPLQSLSRLCPHLCPFSFRIPSHRYYQKYYQLRELRHSLQYYNRPASNNRLRTNVQRGRSCQIATPVDRVQPSWEKGNWVTQSFCHNTKSKRKGRVFI